MTAKVELVGAPKAMADIRRWAGQLGHDLDVGLVPFATTLADRVRAGVPVVSGQLAGSVVQVRDDADAIGVEMGEGLEYAGWIEFGGTRGRPYVAEGRYLFPSLQGDVDEYETAATKVTDESVDRFPWSTPA
jgi:hypothetical protein